MSVAADTGPSAGTRVRLLPEAGKTLGLPAPFLFQLPPLEEVEVTWEEQHTEYDTVSANQFSRHGGSALASVSFQTAVVYDETGYFGGFQDWVDPIEVKTMLLKQMRTGTPIRLTLGQTDMWEGRYDLNMLATLRSLGYANRSGEPETRYLNLAFREWRDPRVGTKLLPKKKKKGKARGPKKTKKKGRDGGTIPSGLTLYDVAREEYGSPMLWRAIAIASGLRNIGPSEELRSRMRPGDSLTIPPNPRGDEEEEYS